MNIDELIAEINSEDFEFSLDSMTKQELSDLYQRLLDADYELQVRLTNLQESEPKPSQEEFEEVVENKRKIEDANQKVSEKWAQLSNSVPVNDQTPEQTPQNIEEDINEKIESEESIEDLERQLNENRKRLEMFNSIANRNGTNNFKSNRTTREIYEKRIQELEEQIENLKNQEEKNDFESAIEENEERNTLDANNEPIALNEIEDSMSTKEKIDSIEKQMDTLFHQITQTKDDITRKKLSDKYFDLSNQLEALKQQLKEEQTLNNEEINDSMSTKEKIDSIEKQMDTLFHQITQTKDDITRKKLSDKYFDLSNQLEALKQQLKEEQTLNNEEINDSMSTKEKIDSIEKQMDTLFHQITQTKDDITRKKLSDKYFDLSNQLEALKQQLKEEQTLNNEEINDSMSTKEKIDSIEKQMDTLFHQITQTKDDITRKKLSDKYFDLSNQLEALKQQLKEEQTLNNEETKDSMSTDEKIVNNSNGSSENNSEKNNPEKNDEKTDEEKKEERRKKIKNAAFFALGGVIGIKLSFVLQLGTAGMVISVGRLVYSAAKKVSKSLKIYTEKHKDDELNPIVKKVGELNDKAIEGIEKGKKQINELLTSIPVINSFVHNVNNLLKKPETQIFLNGMAAGYTIGKISQAVYKMHEASATEKNVSTEKSDIGDDKNIRDNPSKKVTTGDNFKGDSVHNQPHTEITKVDTTPTFDPSKPIDLSSIKNGYVSSYSSDPVSLMTSAGKGAFFDKVNVVNGKTWVHFTQANGAGYAWFPAEDVMDALNISDISELTGKVSGGMHL